MTPFFPNNSERYGSTGLVDDLSMTYDGNRLIKITDDADPVILEQSLDFPKQSATLSYDSEERVISQRQQS